MNRTQRIAIWVATFIGLLVAWRVFGQGFGSFNHDLPYLVVSRTTSQPVSPTNIAGLMYYWNADDVAYGTVTSWPDRIQGLAFQNGDASVLPIKSACGVWLDRTHYLTNGNTSFPTNTTVCFILQFHTNNSLVHPSHPGAMWSDAGGSSRKYFGITCDTFKAGAYVQTSPSFLEYSLPLAQTNNYVFVYSTFTNSTGPGPFMEHFYTNGVLSYSTSNSPNGRMPNYLALGRDSYVDASVWGYYREILVWTNCWLTPNQVQQVYQYATNKYGLGASCSPVIWPQQAYLLSYFDTRSTNDVILNGSKVTNWVNKITASDPATNPTDGPVWYSSGGASNYGYIAFDGTAASFLQFCPTNNGAITNLPFTIAMVHSHADASAHNEGIWSVRTLDGGGSQSTPGMLLENTYGTVGLDAIDTTRGGSCTIATGWFPPAGEWIRTVATFDNATGIQLWTNGVYAGSYLTGCTANPAGPIRFGKFDDMTIYLNGAMHRFMLWRGVLSSNDCITVDTIIKQQFGL